MIGGAILIANIVLNKVFHKMLENIPYELWKGKIFLYKYLKM